MSKEKANVKEVSLEKSIYLAKKEIFPQLEVLVDIILNLEEEVKKVCITRGINPPYLLEWVFDELPCVAYEKPSVDLGVLTDDDDDDDKDEDEKE